MRTIHVQLLGKTWRLKTSRDPKHFDRVVEVVRTALGEVEQATRVADTRDIALLAAINLADALVDAASRETALRKSMRERLQTILDLAEQLEKHGGAGQDAED
ncbi:MAG: hypothetical protein GMKNLPBB_02288 [Myxococcota bacterium]|nr:hypothetical protein [Myxococcota bacterium]